MTSPDQLSVQRQRALFKMMTARMQMKERRDIIKTVQDPAVTTQSFLPFHGVTVGEFVTWWTLTIYKPNSRQPDQGRVGD